MKIAVIDDERPARKELVHQIMDAMPGSQIEEADSGASAIELISRRTFDLLFVDISLGGYGWHHSGGSRQADSPRCPDCVCHRLLPVWSQGL